MRVLFTNEAPIIKYGLAEGFKAAGHEIKIIHGQDERIWGQEISEQKMRLEKAVKDFRPDFVFTEGYPGFNVPVVCQHLCTLKIPHLYWAIEDPVSDFISNTFAPYVDYIFTTTVEYIPRYRQMGKKSELLLFGCNPEFHFYTGIIDEYKHDIVLVANNYNFRSEIVRWFILPIIEKGYDIKIWGLWWNEVSEQVNLLKYPEVYGGLLPYENLPIVYSSAKIVLGLNSDESSSTQTSMRPYEVLACGGGIYLAHYTKAQAKIFGDLIFQSHNTIETMELIDRILAIPQNNRQNLSRIAQDEMYKKHNYKIRAEQIVNAFIREVKK